MASDEQDPVERVEDDVTVVARVAVHLAGLSREIRAGNQPGALEWAEDALTLVEDLEQERDEALALLREVDEEMAYIETGEGVTYNLTRLRERLAALLDGKGGEG